MPGPAPKPPSQRRRRNKPATARQLAPGGARRVPACPKGLSAARRAWWRRVWASPMAAEWLDADVPGLERLARLLDAFDVGGNPALLGPIERLERAFGLSPMARRSLGWEVPGVEAPAQADQSRAAGDDRFLRVLEGGA